MSFADHFKIRKCEYFKMLALDNISCDQINLFVELCVNSIKNA